MPFVLATKPGSRSPVSRWTAMTFGRATDCLPFTACEKSPAA